MHVCSHTHIRSSPPEEPDLHQKQSQGHRSVKCLPAKKVHSCAHWWLRKYAARLRDNNSHADMCAGHETQKGAMKYNCQYI